MEWCAEGILLSVSDLGESSSIIEVFTKDFGTYKGVVRGGKSKKIGPILQPGAQLNVTWRARLENHLGVFNPDLIRSRFSLVLNQRDRLAGLNSICSLLSFCLPERDPHSKLYDRTINLLNVLIDGSDWPLFYLRWELRLLEDMGFGLDLTKCAVTNVKEDLAYISPKSGCAISKNAAGVWVNKLLPLPECLKVGGPTSMADLSIGFEVTGYFLNKWIVPQMNGKPLPVARMRLTDALTRLFKHQNLN